MNTFIFRRNYWLSLLLLDPEKRLEAYEAIMRYAFHGEIREIEELSKECAPVVALICSSIDVDREKYLERVMDNG